MDSTTYDNMGDENSKVAQNQDESSMASAGMGSEVDIVGPGGDHNSLDNGTGESKVREEVKEGDTEGGVEENNQQSQKKVPEMEPPAANLDESSMASAGMGSAVDIVGAGGDHNSLDNGTEESKVREEVGKGDTEGGVDENNQQPQEKVPEMEPPAANLESAHDETGGTNLPTTNNDGDQQDSAIGSEAKELLSSRPSTMSSEELSTKDDHESEQDGSVQDAQTPANGTVQDMQAPTEDGIANGAIEESDSSGVEEKSSDSKDIESDLSTNQSVAGADDNESKMEADVQEEEELVVDQEEKHDVVEKEEDEGHDATYKEGDIYEGEPHQDNQLGATEDLAQSESGAEDPESEDHLSSTAGTPSPLSSDTTIQSSSDGSSHSSSAAEEDIPAKFAKQYAVMKIKKILKERGPVSLQVLNSILGEKITTQDRDAVGRKADQVLQTLTEFSDVFLFESRTDVGGTLLDQQFVSVKKNSREDSLTFARTILKIPQIVKKKGNLTMAQLSTFLNAESSVEEKASVGRSPALLKETLLSLPTVFQVSDEDVSVIRQLMKLDTIDNQPQPAPTPVPPPAMAQNMIPTPTAAVAASSSDPTDCTFEDKHLGILKIKEILQERGGKSSLQILCSAFGQRASDAEREAVGWKNMVVLETLKEFGSMFNIVSPKIITVQEVATKTQVSLKHPVNQTSVLYASAIVKLIRILKLKETVTVTQLCTFLGLNSTVDERETVGRNPMTLKKTLKSNTRIFKVSGEIVTMLDDARMTAAKLFVLPPQQEPLPSISATLRKAVVAKVKEMLKSEGGSADVTILVRYIKSCGSPKAKEIFGSSGSALLKLLKTMPDQFRCEGSKVHVANTGQKSKTFSGLATSIPTLGASNTNVHSSQVLNPIPVQGVVPTSQAKVIPSIEIVFDTKTSGTRGWWGDVNVSQATTTGQQQPTYSTVTATPPPMMSINPQSTQAGGMTTSDMVKQFYLERNAHSGPAATGGVPKQVPSGASSGTTQATGAKASAIGKLAAWLDQCKIATIIQITGIVGSKMTATERNAVGKSPALLYDTLSLMRSKFIIDGPFIGVRRHGALVTGIAKLVSYLESKGKCQLSSLYGRLGQSGTTHEKSAVGMDFQAFTETISGLSGVFITEGTAVYLNNRMNGKPCSPTPMNKFTAVTTTTDKVLWALSTGTYCSVPKNIQSINQTSQTAASTQAVASNQPVQAPDPNRPNFSATVVAIGNYELCQEFVDTCLAKYEYPIISLAVNKTQNWIALAGWEDHVYLFDMEQAALKKGSMEDGGFKILADVISSTKILKVVHSCTYVSSFLHESYGMKLCNVFDTKVAYQLLCGESTISIHALCKEYGVVNPDKWVAKWSDRAGSVADTVRKPSDDRTGGFARVLIPQIYQHMVMKFSDDSLQEVGKLCEAFLHQQETNTSSASAAPPDSITTNPAQPASQAVTNGCTNASALTNLPSAGAQSSQSYAMPQQGDLKMSFEATHSKVCNFLKTNGPASIASLYGMVHRSGAILADTDLDVFKKSLLRVTSKYILLESGLIDLVEHVKSQAVGKIVTILQDRGLIKLELLFWEFVKVASGDEIRVAASTEKAFEKTLMCMGCIEVCEGCVALKAGMDREIEEILAQAMMCSQFKLEQRPDEHDIMSHSNATQIEATAESEPDHRMSWITAEKESNLKAKTDTIGTADDWNHNLTSSFCDDSLSGESYTSDLHSLLEENFQEKTAAGRARTISGDLCTESEIAQKITEYVTRLLEYIGRNGPSTPSQLLTVLHKDEDAKEVVRNTKELSHLLLVQSDNFEFRFADLVGIKPTALTSQNFSKKFRQAYSLPLQQFVEKNGPSTLAQLLSILYNQDQNTDKIVPDTKALSDLLRRYPDKFTFLPSGHIGPVEGRIRAAEKIVDLLQDKEGGYSIMEVYQWFCQHISTEERMAVFGNSCTVNGYKKRLKQFQHLFVVESDRVILQPSILKDTTTATKAVQAPQATSSCESTIQTDTSETTHECSGSLKKKWVLKLQQYVDQNGPCTFSQLESVLFDRDEVKMAHYREQVESLVNIHTDKFTLLPMGLIGPNQIRLKAAEKIVIFLRGKAGCCSFKETNEWFRQHASTEEKHAMYANGGSTATKPLKKKLKRMPHLFAVEGNLVSLQPSELQGATLEPQASQTTNTNEMAMHTETSTTSYKDSYHFRNEDIIGLQQPVDRNGPSTLAQLKDGDESDVQDVPAVTNGNVDLEEDTQYDSMSFSDISDDVHNTQKPDERLSAEHNSDHAEVTKNTKGKEENHGPAQIQSHSPHKSGLDKVHRYLTDHGPTVVLQLFRDIQTITSPEEQRCLGLTAVELMTTLQISSQHTFVIWGESIIVDVGRERKELVDETIRFLERIQGQCSLAVMSLWLHQEFPRGIPGMNVTVETLRAMPNVFRVSDTGVSLLPGINSGSRTSHYLGPAGGRIISRYLGPTGTNNSDCDVDYRISSMEKDRKREEKVQRRKEKAEKRQYKSRLLQYLQQHGPCTLSHLYDNVEAEVEINSIENLRKFMKGQGDTFTFFPSGLVGANEERMRLAEMIVTFLQQKGRGCSFEEIDEWFCQHASKEERKVFRGHAKLKQKKRFKKAVKSLTHLFVVDGEQVSLCHSRLKRESTLPLADEVIRQTEISKVFHECDNMNATMPCSVNTQHDDISSESDAGSVSNFSDCSASDESCTCDSEMHSLPMQKCAEAVTAGRGMSCEHYDNSHTKLQNAQKRTEYVTRLKQYVKRNGPCTLAQLLSVLHEDDEAKVVVCDIKELSDLLLIRSDDFTFVFADLVGLKRKSGRRKSLSDQSVSGRSHISDPKLRNQSERIREVNDTVYRREEEALSKKRRSKKRGCYGLRLQQYVDKNGPCTLTKLLSILYEEDKDAKRVVSNTKELIKLLKARKDRFTFLPSGLVGPKEVRLSAAHKIVGFLQGKSSSGCNIKEVDEWLCQHGSNEEKNAMIGIKDNQKKLTRNLKRLTHLFVIKETAKVALHPSVTLKQVSQPTSEHSSERTSQYTSEYHSLTSTEIQQSASEFKLTPTSAMQNHQNMAQHPSNTEKMFETNRKENSIVQIRQESPLQCDQDVSTVSDLLTAGSTQSSFDLQQVAQVTNDPPSNASAGDIVKSKKKTKKDALLAASSGHLRETYEKVLTTCGFLKSSYINHVASFVETNGPVSLKELQKELILMLDCDGLAYVCLEEIAHILAIGKGCKTLIKLPSGLITLGPKIYNGMGYLQGKYIHPLIKYIDENGPTRLSILQSMLQEHIGSEYTITEKEFKQNLRSVLYQIHFRVRFGLVEHNHAKLQAVQKVVDFIGAGNTCSLADIWKWFDENASSRDKDHLGESKKCLCKQLPLLPSVFYVDKDGVTCMQENESIYNKTGYFKKKLLDPLMVYVDRNGPISIATFRSLLQEEIGSELTISEKELLRNLQSEQYEIHFSVNERSGLVGPNKAKQQAVQKVVEFINSFVRVIKFTESSANAYFFGSVWYWFDTTASSTDKTHLGTSKQVFKERLKAMPHIFIVDDECVYLTPEYACGLSDKSVSARTASCTHSSIDLQQVAQVTEDQLAGATSLFAEVSPLHHDITEASQNSTREEPKKPVLIKSGLRIKAKHMKQVEKYVDTNGPSTVSELQKHLAILSGDEYVSCMSQEQFQKVLHIGGGLNSLIILPSGLISSAAQHIVSFLEKNGPSDITGIFAAWRDELCNLNQNCKLKTTESEILKKLKKLSDVFHIEGNGRRISVKLSYSQSAAVHEVSEGHSWVNTGSALSTNSDMGDVGCTDGISNTSRIPTWLPQQPDAVRITENAVIGGRIHDKMGYLHERLLEPLMVYVDRNGPTHLATAVGVLQKTLPIGLGYRITEWELERNLQSPVHEIHFILNWRSGLVGPNEVKQQAIQKIVHVIASSGNTCLLKDVWYWFDQNASSVTRKHLGQRKDVFEKRLKALSHIFYVDGDYVHLQPEYAITNQSRPTCAYSFQNKESEQVTVALPASVEISAGIIHDDCGEEAAYKTRTYPCGRKRYGLMLQQYVDKNGPCTLAQLLSVLHQEDRCAKGVIRNTKELTDFLKIRRDRFTFLPTGLIGPNEVKLSAAQKIVGFLQDKDRGCSFKEIDEWLCQHGSKEDWMVMIGRGDKQRKLKRNLKRLTHLFVIEGEIVSLHPSMTLERRSQFASECHSLTSTRPPQSAGGFNLTQTLAMLTQQNMTQHPSTCSTENMFETRSEEYRTVQSRQESPLQCDQDVSSVSSTVSDLVTVDFTQSSLDLQQAAQVNEEQLAGASSLFAATEASPLHQDITNASSGHSRRRHRRRRRDGILTTSRIPAWLPQQPDADNTKPRPTYACNFLYKECEQSAKTSPVSVEIPARILTNCQYGAMSKAHDTSNHSFTQVDNDISVVPHDFNSEGVGSLAEMKSSDISATKSKTPNLPQSFQSSSDSLQSTDGPAAYNQVLSTWSDEADEDKKGCDITHSSSAFEVASPVHNPWGITQQLKDQFAYRNKHDMDKLMAVLGEDITRNLTKLDQSAGMDCGLALMLTEVVLDCGRNAQARFYQKASPNSTLDVNISGSPVKQESIQSILDNDWTSPPTPDKRAGIEDTLHRLGIITNRSGRAIGLTASIGRAVLGCVDHIHNDLLQDGQSVVMLGRPGVGMTTVLREIARVLSDVKKRRVIIIDTYNQIGGDSDAPHPAIGSARRLQVASRAEQYQTIVEAVQNHTPQTIIVDEIAMAPEAQAVKKLVQRGVQVITTAHSCNFVDFYQNPEFRHVTGMGEDGGEMSGSKKTKPAFQVLIELCDRDRWIVHKDIGSSIDAYLQGMRPVVEERQRTWDYNKGSFTNQQCIVKLIEAPLSSNSL